MFTLLVPHSLSVTISVTDVNATLRWFLYEEISLVDDNSSRLSLASELHLLKWEVRCVGRVFFKAGYI